MKRLTCVAALVLCLPGLLFSRTRQDVLDEAAVYAAHPWTPVSKNLLDVNTYKYDSDSGQWKTIVSTDGVDDRAQARYNDSTKKWEYSETGNRSWWPFEVCSTCAYHGEAYAWGIDDTPDTFKNKLEEKVWIAGSQDGDILPEKYLGFAGIDCSRLASRLIELQPTTWTDSLKGISLPISYKDLKKGDWLFRTDVRHVLIFADEKFEEQSNINIVHSVSWAYGWSEHVRRVIEDNSMSFLTKPV